MSGDKIISKENLQNVLEQLIKKNRRPINDIYFGGKVDAYNDIWKLINGIDDDYSDGIDLKSLVVSK